MNPGHTLVYFTMKYLGGFFQNWRFSPQIEECNQQHRDRLEGGVVDGDQFQKKPLICLEK